MLSWGVHDAEADVFAVQAFEGGAVADHETLADAGVEDVPGGQAGLLDFQEEKVGVGRVGFVSGNNSPSALSRRVRSERMRSRVWRM